MSSSVKKLVFASIAKKLLLATEAENLISASTAKKLVFDVNQRLVQGVGFFIIESTNRVG